LGDRFDSGSACDARYGWPQIAERAMDFCLSSDFGRLDYGSITTSDYFLSYATAFHYGSYVWSQQRLIFDPEKADF
jgi:hypothetical protein